MSLNVDCRIQNALEWHLFSHIYYESNQELYFLHYDYESDPSSSWASERERERGREREGVGSVAPFYLDFRASAGSYMVL